MSFVDDLIGRINDTERRLGRIERLDVNPPASSVARVSGTPVAGQFAYWTGAGTIAGTSTYGTATVGLLGVANTWTAAQTYVGAVEVFSAAGGVSDNDATMMEVVAVGDCTSTQSITVDFLLNQNIIRTIVTEFELTCARNGNTTTLGFYRGVITWRHLGTATPSTVSDYDVSHQTSGTDASVLPAAINDGVRIVLDSSAFGNTLDRNTLRYRHIGNGVQTATVTVTIA